MILSAQPLTVSVRELKTTAQLAGLIPTDHPTISTWTLQLLEEVYKEYGMPNEAEIHAISEFGQVPIKVVEDWCKQTMPLEQHGHEQN